MTESEIAGEIGRKIGEIGSKIMAVNERFFEAYDAIEAAREWEEREKRRARHPRVELRLTELKSGLSEMEGSLRHKLPRAWRSLEDVQRHVEAGEWDSAKAALKDFMKNVPYDITVEGPKQVVEELRLSLIHI